MTIEMFVMFELCFPDGVVFSLDVDCVSNMRLLWSYYPLDISQILLYKILLNHPLTSIPRPLSPPHSGPFGKKGEKILLRISSLSSPSL